MALTFLTSPSRADRARACELLGSDDPLVRLLGRIGEAVDQAAASAAIGLGVILWLALDGPWGTELAIAAAVLSLGVTGRLAVLRSARDELVLERIIRGEDDMPLVAVTRLRRRLLDCSARRRLARTIAAIRDASARAPLVRGTPTNARVMDAVERDLERLIELLGAEQAGIRGTARAYRLVTGPASPLYGDDVLALREELNQVLFLLEAGS